MSESITTSEERRARRAPRFSLATMLFVVAILGLSVSHIATSVRLKDAEEEVKSLRQEVGYLAVEPANEHKLHAVAVPTVESLTWRWRVHVPEGRKFRLYAVTNQIPATGVPESGSSTGLPSGDYLFTIAVRKDYRDKWELILQFDSGNMKIGFPPETVERLLDHRGWGFNQAGKGDPTIVEPGKSEVLLRFRLMEPVSETMSTTPDGPAHGFIVWVDEQK